MVIKPRTPKNILDFRLGCLVSRGKQTNPSRIPTAPQSRYPMGSSAMSDHQRGTRARTTATYVEGLTVSYLCHALCT